MGNIAIIDTGFLTTTATTGTQATRANSGNAINLKSVELSFQGSGNIDDSPIINSNTNAVLNFGSITNELFKVRGLMKRTNTTDMDLLKEINLLKATYGIKLIYYTDISDGFRDLTDSLGSTDVAHLSGTIPHLHVRVTNFKAQQIGNTNIIRYTIEMRTTA